MYEAFLVKWIHTYIHTYIYILKLQTVLNCFVLCGLISAVQSTGLDLVAMKMNNNSDTDRGSHLNTSSIHGSGTMQPIESVLSRNVTTIVTRKTSFLFCLRLQCRSTQSQIETRPIYAHLARVLKLMGSSPAAGIAQCRIARQAPRESARPNTK